MLASLNTTIHYSGCFPSSFAFELFNKNLSFNQDPKTSKRRGGKSWSWKQSERGQHSFTSGVRNQRTEPLNHVGGLSWTKSWTLCEVSGFTPRSGAWFTFVTFGLDFIPPLWGGLRTWSQSYLVPWPAASAHNIWYYHVQSNHVPGLKSISTARVQIQKLCTSSGTQVHEHCNTSTWRHKTLQTHTNCSFMFELQL